MAHEEEYDETNEMNVNVNRPTVDPLDHQCVESTGSQSVSCPNKISASSGFRYGLSFLKASLCIRILIRSTREMITAQRKLQGLRVWMFMQILSFLEIR